MTSSGYQEVENLCRTFLGCICGNLEIPLRNGDPDHR
jgi:hypothetical protein